MATVLKAKGDALWKRDDDPGYRIGWKYKYRFEKGHLEGEMTYGEARRKAAELQANGQLRHLGVADVVAAPHPVDQGLTGQDAAGVGEQQVEQLELLERHRKFPAVERHSVLLRVECHVADLHESLSARSVTDAFERVDADLARLVALFDRHDIRAGDPRSVTADDAEVASYNVTSGASSGRSVGSSIVTGWPSGSSNTTSSAVKVAALISSLNVTSKCETGSFCVPVGA